MSKYYQFPPLGLIVEIQPARSDIKSTFNLLKYLASTTKVCCLSNPNLSDKEITLLVHKSALAIKQEYEVNRGFIAKIIEFIKHFFCIITEHDQILVFNKQIQKRHYVVDTDTLNQELFLKEYFTELCETAKARSNLLEDSKIVEEIFLEDFPDSPTAKEVIEELKSFAAAIVV